MPPPTIKTSNEPLLSLLRLVVRSGIYASIITPNGTDSISGNTAGVVTNVSTDAVRKRGSEPCLVRCRVLAPYVEGFRWKSRSVLQNQVVVPGDSMT